VVPIGSRVAKVARPALFPAVARIDASFGPAPTKTNTSGALNRAHIF